MKTIQEIFNTINEAKKKSEEVEAYGVKGFNRTQWQKTFKSYDELNKWAEKNDAEILGFRSLNWKPGEIN